MLNSAWWLQPWKTPPSMTCRRARRSISLSTSRKSSASFVFTRYGMRSSKPDQKPFGAVRMISSGISEGWNDGAITLRSRPTRCAAIAAWYAMYPQPQVLNDLPVK